MNALPKNCGTALAEFDTATNLDATYMPPYFHIGRVAAQANVNVAMGEIALHRYVAPSPKNTEPTLANAYYFLGLICERQRKRFEAKRNYAQAQNLNPTLKDASEALKRCRNMANY